MAEFIWIASYPKSGCTWLRYIVTHLLFTTEGEVPNPSDAVPDMHDFTGQIKYTWQGAYPVKTHLYVENLPPRMHTRAAVHIIRNPLDVVDSSVAYLRTDTLSERADLINTYGTHGGIEPWRTMLGYGSWQGNVASWIDTKHDFPVLFFRYEEMLADPHDHVRRLAEFFSTEVSDERVDEIVQLTSFSSLRALEEKEVAESSHGVFSDEQREEKPDFRFMRSGKAGSYVENLSEDEISRLTEYFRPTMEVHGYL